MAAFDLAADGAVVYTSGYDVVGWRDGVTRKLGRSELVESVSAAPMP